jgi:hypothetical protein
VPWNLSTSKQCVKKYLDLFQICQPLFDFHLSSIKNFIEFYITIRFTTSFKTMIINFELLCSECKVWWFIFEITVIISTRCFVFKCLWGKNTIKGTMATKVKIFTRIAFYTCPTCIGLLNIKIVF